MKNIRMYEDGNRMIIVLEGYGKPVVQQLIEALGTEPSKLEHIAPHTGESEPPVLKKAAKQEAEIASSRIVKPNFVKNISAEKPAQTAAAAALPEGGAGKAAGQKDPGSMDAAELARFLESADQIVLGKIIKAKGRFAGVQQLLNAKRDILAEYAAAYVKRAGTSA